MSLNRRCSCIVPGCKMYGKEIHADVKCIQKHLLEKHGHELGQIAFDLGIISSPNGYINYKSISHELAEKCFLVESQ